MFTFSKNHFRVWVKRLWSWKKVGFSDVQLYYITIVVIHFDFCHHNWQEHMSYNIYLIHCIVLGALKTCSKLYSTQDVKRYLALGIDEIDWFQLLNKEATLLLH